MNSITETGKLVEQLSIYMGAKYYSENSIRTYTSLVHAFLNRVGQRPKDINANQIRLYLSKCKSRSSIAQNINALSIFYEHIVKQPRKFDHIEYPRKEHKLPVFFSQQEMQRLLDATPNLKHRCILLTIYSAGLRISECINLKLPDILRDSMRILVRGGKGNKDRLTTLAPVTLRSLEQYYRIYKPKEYLFEGQIGGRYSKSSIEKIFKCACQRAGIFKIGAKVHSLRHSFATHLIEQGVATRIVQNLLGHTSIRTTEQYTHVTNAYLNNVQSPAVALPEVTYTLPTLMSPVSFQTDRQFRLPAFA